jgi:5,10-methylenetetrahydrofolate reductase
MCDRAVFMNRQPMKVPPRLFIGGADAPLTEPRDFRPHRLGKKVVAGADFIQTQLIFDVDGFREYMRQVRDLGLHRKVAILPGVGVLPGVKTARAINANVPGLTIPDDVIRRLEAAPKERQRDEGIAIATEIVQALQGIEGVAGVHLTAMFQKGKADAIQAIGEAAGLLPRPSLAWTLDGEGAMTVARPADEPASKHG